MSDYSVQLEGKLKALSLSADAARWVMKAMDPVRGGPTQIPDAIQVPTLVPEYKVSEVINGPGGTSNWDCCIISPPSDAIAFMYAVGSPGTDFSTNTGSATTIVRNTTAVYSPDNLFRGAQISTATGGSFTGVWNGRSIVSSEMPAMWRTAARSITVYATGSELYNQGTVYAGQYARPCCRQVGQALAAPSGQNAVVNVEAVALPLKEQDMAVVTPGFYAASAREGVYSVARLTGPAQEFVTAKCPSQWRVVDGTAIAVSITDPTNFNSATSSVFRVFQEAPWALSPVFAPGVDGVSTGFDERCTWGVTIFRGLHPQMSLTVKNVTCLELVPTPAAPSRQFIKPPMRFEPTAIAAYYALASELSPCMASKHNFLGSILPILSQVASKILPFVGPAIGQGLGALGSYLTGGSQRAAQTTPMIAATPARAPAPVRSRAGSVVSRRSMRSGVSSRRVRIARKKKGGARRPK